MMEFFEIRLTKLVYYVPCAQSNYYIKIISTRDAFEYVAVVSREFYANPRNRYLLWPRGPSFHHRQPPPGVFPRYALAGCRVRVC